MEQTERLLSPEETEKARERVYQRMLADTVKDWRGRIAMAMHVGRQSARTDMVWDGDLTHALEAQLRLQEELVALGWKKLDIVQVEPPGIDRRKNIELRWYAPEQE